MDLVSSVLSKEQDKIERIFNMYSNSNKEMTSRDFVRLASVCGVERHVATVTWTKATSKASSIRKIRLNRDDFKNVLLPDFCLQVRQTDVSVLLEQMLVEKKKWESRRRTSERTQPEEVEKQDAMDELSSFMQTSSLGQMVVVEKERETRGVKRSQQQQQ